MKGGERGDRTTLQNARTNLKTVYRLQLTPRTSEMVQQSRRKECRKQLLVIEDK